MTYGIRTILLATDLGPRSGAVFRHAVGIAERFGARLHLVSVMSGRSERPMVSLDSYLPDEAIPALRESARNRMRERIDELLREVGAGQQEVLGTVEILEGDAAEQVLSAAERLSADMTVLGSNGHSALGEVLIGSVAHKVTVKSKVPVLLVPIND